MLAGPVIAVAVNVTAARFAALAVTDSAPGVGPSAYPVLAVPAAPVVDVDPPSFPAPLVFAHVTPTLPIPCPIRSLTFTPNGAFNARFTVSVCPDPDTIASTDGSPGV